MKANSSELLKLLDTMYHKLEKHNLIDTKLNDLYNSVSNNYNSIILEEVDRIAGEDIERNV